MFTLNDVDKEFVSVPEAARRLNVTPAHLYTLISKKKLKSYSNQINRRVLVDWDEVQQKFHPTPRDDQGEE